jgi:cytochrome c peroxidase
MWFDERMDVPLRDAGLPDDRDFGDLGIFIFAETGMWSAPLDVPQLTNIYDSPPYLHNGAANTLEEIWTRFNYTESHGLTRDLTRQQLNDLMAYLRAL